MCHKLNFGVSIREASFYYDLYVALEPLLCGGREWEMFALGYVVVGNVNDK